MSGIKKHIIKRKVFSIFAVVCLLVIQAGVFSVYADAEPSLILQMDLSSYDGTSASISDNAGNAATFFQSTHVKKGSFRNAAGEDVPFIDLYNDGNSRGRAWIVEPESEGLESETISCWVRMSYDNISWGVLTAKVNAMDTDQSNFEVGIGGDSNVQIWVMSAGNGSDIARLPIAPYMNSWKMFTFTREWNGNTINWKTYVDGVFVDDIAFSGTSDAFTKKIASYETYGLSSKFAYEGDGGTLVDFATFDVYDGVLSDAQIAELYQNSYINFEEFDGTFAPNGEQISIYERELLIDLPSGLSYEEAIASVTITDEFGDEPEGGIDVSLVGSTIAKVRFGKLKPNTTYTITGGRDGDCIVTTGGEYLINENFEAWDEGEIIFSEEELGKNYTKRNDLTFGHSDNTLSQQTYTVVSDGAGKYINLATKGGHINVAVGLKLDSYLTEGEIVYEMKVKPDKPGGSLLPISKIWGENLGSGFYYKDSEINTDYKEASSFDDFKKDSNGFLNLRCLLSIKPVTEEIEGETKEWKNITVTFFDKLSDSKIVFTKIVNPESKVGAIEFVSAYTNGAATDNISIDDIMAYRISTLDVVTNLNGFDPSKKEMEIVFSDEVSEETLEKNLITISKGDKIINTKFVEKNGRRVKVKLSEHLDYNTEYSISLSGLELESGNLADTSNVIKFNTRAYDITAGITKRTNSIEADITNNADSNKKILILLVGYDQNGVICEVASDEITLSSGETPAQKPTLTLIKEAEKTDVFVWDTTSGMKPVKWILNE